MRREICIQKSKRERQTEPFVCVAVQRVIYPERRSQVQQHNSFPGDWEAAESTESTAEADVPPPSRSLLAEAAVAGIRVNNQVEAANKQREEENNHSDGKQQALVCLHALNHMLYRTPRCCCCCCYLLHRHYMERPQVQGEPQRRALSPLKCKVAAEAEAAAAALLHQTSLFFSYNGMRAVNRRLRGRKDKKIKNKKSTSLWDK